MTVDITIPSVGESITEATVVRWLKKDGELVRQGEPLVELETEKASADLPAPATGKLRIGADEGKTLAVGETIGTIDESAEKPEKKKEPPKPVPAKKEAAKKENGEEKPRQEKETEQAKEKEERPTATPARQPPALSPTARRLAREKSKVEAPPRPEADEREAERPARDGESRKPMTPIRRRIAERLLASQRNAATLTTFNEADLSAIQDFRARYREDFRETHGVDLGLVCFFVKACVNALRKHPIVNARIDGGDIVYHQHCNIGVAVSTDKGLMVPVLHQAEQMNLMQIEKAIEELAEKARAGKIGVQDLEGGTFTITNGGVFGSLLSTPILNPPQSAILGMHVIQKRPVVVNDEIVIRPMMYLALSYDHRLIDGRDAVQFLVVVRKFVENPILMLLEG